ncbi:uncharacterized protein METZ01_LOCUS489136, partial [marine metagenome]
SCRGHTVGMGGSQIRIRQQLKTYPPSLTTPTSGSSCSPPATGCGGLPTTTFTIPTISTNLQH